MDKTLQDGLNDALATHNYKSALDYCHSLIKAGDQSPHLKAVNGWCLYKLGKTKEAEVLLVEAFNQDSKNHFIATVTISFYMERGEYEQVITLTQYCVGLHASDRLMWHRLGTAQFMLGDLAGSVIAFRRSLQVEALKSTAFALSQPLLCQGHYQEGLELYEHRFDSYPQINWPQSEKMPMPKWQGESLNSKSLLVWTEQGFGDCIQFSRIITVLFEQGAVIDLMISNSHASLAPLLETLKGVENVNVIDNKEVTLNRRYDYHSPMMSLMRGIKLTPTSVPAPDGAYLHIPQTEQNAALTEQLTEIASHNNELKIGIVWTTALKSSFKEHDFLHFLQKERKSLNSDDVLPLLQLGKGFRFYSLHLEKSPALQRVLDSQAVTDTSHCIGSFTDTARLIDAMDVIISIDTSVVHLAGALGKPTINLLPFAADWRWQCNREDSPWYPTMRLLRQSFRNDWSTVILRLQTLLPKIRNQQQKTGEVQVFL